MRRPSALTPEFNWDPRAGRFASVQSGRFIARSQVREALDTALDNGGQQIAKLATDLREGRVALADWQLSMAREVKSIHLASVALAKGGWEQLSQADYGRAGQAIRQDYAYLAGFAKEIAAGDQLLDGTLLTRAELYAQAGRRTYHAVERREMTVRGMSEERSVLGAADHCEECVSEAAAGWRPIGEMVPIGARICLTRCRCSVQFRTAEEAAADV